MICTEVGELMQRQLDHDLDEQELTVLMTHLGECKACQSLFERLTLLSGSLEQLPRVTPSISIVDSILPELDAIDRQRAAEAAKPVKSGYWKRWMTAAASVAAAAAVVLIMTNLDGANKQVSDLAAPEMSTQRESSDVARKDMGIMTTQTSSSDESASSVEDVQTESTVVEDSGYSITPLSSPIESSQSEPKGKTESTDHDSRGPIDYTPVPTSQSSQLPQATQLPTMNAAPLPEVNERNEIPDVGISMVPQQPEVDKELTESGEQLEVVSNMQNQFGEETQKDSGTVDEDSNSLLGIASQDTFVEKHFSPDGQVYIVLEGHTIVLYETSTEQQQRTWEVEATGNLSFVEWDNTSSSFVYELQAEDGSSSLYTVNLKD